MLILGSFPGTLSLRSGEYYAHPRNTFWQILHRLGIFRTDESYPKRIASLKRRGIALWDVCAMAARRGSADATINVSSAGPNDLLTFLHRHRQIERILLNGRKAEALFQRYARTQGVGLPGIARVWLPSTSPANAATPWLEKVTKWRAGLRGV